MGIFFRDDGEDYEQEHWKIGDPVDYLDGAMDPINWGHGGSDDDDYEEEPEESNHNYSKINEYSQDAWDYYLKGKYKDALYCINQALDLNWNHANNWNTKAIILEGMERYEESEECYNKSLKLSAQNLVFDNKARMLRKWAIRLTRESKEIPNGLDKLKKALEINFRAIKALPGENSEENLNDYLSQREFINSDINYENRFHTNLKALKEYPKEELFTIAGPEYYDTGITLTPGKPLRLVKEPDNEHDRAAIAVYVKDEKIGYVANSDYTKCHLTSSASELNGKIPSTAEGEYLFYLERYDIRFRIGRIIK